jgi:hypothetical protein
MVAEPDLVGSCALVAAISTEAAVVGAVKRPLALIVPPLVTDQETAELKAPVP